MFGWVYRAIPVGMITILLFVITVNVFWMYGLAGGYTAAVNDSKSPSYYHDVFDNASASAMDNVSDAEKESFKIAQGVSLEQLVGVWVDAGHNGIDFGYRYPNLSRVLVEYQIPFVLPVVSYGLFKYPVLNDIYHKFRGY